MAIKYECDVCGRQTSEPADIGSVRFPRMYEDPENRTAYSKEMCKYCLIKVEEFITKLGLEKR